MTPPEILKGTKASVSGNEVTA